MSGKQNAAGLRTGIKSRSPEKEGGTLYLPDGTEMPYGDAKNPSVTEAAIAAAARWEKRALLDRKAKGELSGSIRDTSDRYPKVEEYCNVSFSLSKAQSRASDKEMLGRYHDAIKETIFEFAGRLGVENAKPLLWLDKPHFDRENYHIQFRVGLHPVNYNNEEKKGDIAKKSFDIYKDSSLASDFANRLKEKFIEKNLPAPDNNTTIAFIDEAGRLINAKMFGENLPSAEDYFEEIEASKELQQDYEEPEHDEADIEKAPVKQAKAEASVEKPAEFKIEYTQVEQYQSSIVKQLRAIDAEQELRDAKRAELLLELNATKHTLSAMTENQSLRDKLVKAEKLVQKSTNEKLSLVGDLSDAKKDLSVFKGKLLDANKNNQALIVQNQTLITEKQALINEKQGLTSENKGLSAQNEQLIDAVNKATEYKLGIDSKLDELKVESIDKLFEQMAEVNEALDLHEFNTISELSDDLTATNKQVLDAVAFAEEYKKKVETKEQELKDKEVVLNSQKTTIETLTAALNDQTSAINTLKNSIEAVEAAMKAQKVEFERQLEVQKAEFAKQLAAQTAAVKQAEAVAEKQPEQAKAQVMGYFQSVTPNADEKAVERALDGYKTQKTMNGSVIYVNANNEKAFVDNGRGVATYKKELSVADATAMFELAAKKWPEGVKVVSDNEAFKQQMVAIAAEKGIKLANPELQEQVEKLQQQQVKTIEEVVGDTKDMTLDEVLAAIDQQEAKEKAEATLKDKAREKAVMGLLDAIEENKKVLASLDKPDFKMPEEEKAKREKEKNKTPDRDDDLR